MDGLGTLLGVWAHPDDETFGTAGLMAAAVRDGRRVVCVTATRGEAGIQDEQRWPAARLANIRTKELEAALRVLGVTEHVWLDYPDGDCVAVLHEDAVDRIARIISDVQPDSVLTFGPDGMTGHPDHIALSSWVTEAFHRAAKPGARLLYFSVPPEWVEEFMAEWERVGAMMAGEVLVTPREEIEVDFHLPDDLLELKVEALKKQESQSESAFALMGEDFMRRDLAHEYFRLGARK